MRTPGRRALGGALLLAAAAVPAPARAQDGAEVARARQVLEYYQDCERSRRFAPCWALLSARVQAEWARQGRGTVEEYAASRGASEPRFSDFRVQRIRRSPSRLGARGVRAAPAERAVADRRPAGGRLGDHSMRASQPVQRPRPARRTRHARSTRPARSS
jgi:hypothetical protein